jgi:hypothetical protein
MLSASILNSQGEFQGFLCLELLRRHNQGHIDVLTFNI